MNIALSQSAAESLLVDVRECVDTAMSQATEGKPTLDFGHIEITVEGSGALVGFASMMEEPKPLPTFLQHNIGLIPITEATPRTFAVPWMMVAWGRREKPCWRPFSNWPMPAGAR